MQLLTLARIPCSCGACSARSGARGWCGRSAAPAALARPAREITLLEVHRAVVGAKHEVIDLHAPPNPRCPVGRNIAAALEAPFEEARRAVERTLARRTVASVSAPIRAAIRRERAWKAQGAAEP